MQMSTFVPKHLQNQETFSFHYIMCKFILSYHINLNGKHWNVPYCDKMEKNWRGRNTFARHCIKFKIPMFHIHLRFIPIFLCTCFLCFNAKFGGSLANEFHACYANYFILHETKFSLSSLPHHKYRHMTPRDWKWALIPQNNPAVRHQRRVFFQVFQEIPRFCFSSFLPLNATKHHAGWHLCILDRNQH